jgi:adenine-specific DNA-methyltransferase
VNIPTEELRGFITDEENNPIALRYPRNVDIDPQLVWRGKDSQDTEDLEVIAPPIYIQEKIHPQAIIEDIRKQAKKDSPSPELDFFSDFNGISFEQLIDFYKHEHKWSNRLILGDSLQVMASLAEKERLKGKVQMIYFDPPYGIKFGSNWQVSTRKRDVKDGKAEDFTRQPEQVKAFRDTWELGIHSYLSYMRDRLTVARDLLTESGSIFVQIGDENVHLVRCLLDEVFGSGNFVSQISIRTTMGAGSQIGTISLPAVTSYVIWYGKNSEKTKIRDLYEDKADMQSASLYSLLRFLDGSERKSTQDELNSLPTDARLFRPDNITSQSPRNDGQFTVSFEGQQFTPRRGYWKTNQEGMKRLIYARRIRPTAGKTIQYIRFLDDFPVVKRNNFWPDGLTGSFTEDKVYVVQSPSKIVARCLLMSTDPGDLVLDPTCGSGTTAYVAEQWGRRWITIDTSRVALALARTRLMTARYPYYQLADTANQNKDIRKGFVYKTVPHITLKAIANNPQIDDIYNRWKEKLEPQQAKINEAFKPVLNKMKKTHFEEWEIPRDVKKEIQEKLQADLPNNAQQLLDNYWELRIGRQQEIDDSINRNAEQETLYDQPYEDKKYVRVTGPFTVESLSPHRILPTSDNLLRPVNEIRTKQNDTENSFIETILKNLQIAGVQNTVKNERLKFDTLEPFAGVWLHAEGNYTEQDNTTKRVAVSIGSEHGTVDSHQIKEAAKEAIQGAGFDLLLVCGFAFDPSVSEEAKRYGKLTVLPVKMNPDLAMGDDLLKKTGSGNLFMIFGEPDIQPIDPKTGKLQVQDDGQIIIEIKGLDIYDPTTGQIRSHSTDEIACWLIDTDYNNEAFFARHVYFTGGDQPYEKLKKALKAEVDESAWDALYTTKSRPFPKPKDGKVAVKIINHYGDEVLKVFEVF